MPDSASPRYALVLGHPGHELRVLGWAKRSRPMVAILTDGSGSEGQSRIPLSLEIMDALGCRSLQAQGRLTDAEIYAAILSGRVEEFLTIADGIADSLEANAIDRVVSDSVEGYNPTHDLCAALAARATRLCANRTGRTMIHYTFPLTGPAVTDSVSADAILVELDATEVNTKLDLSRQYAARAGGVLVDEVEDMINRFGAEGFAREMFVPADLDRDFSPYLDTQPYYESYGQKRVAAGHYQHAIRYREHMLPILDALRA